MLGPLESDVTTLVGFETQESLGTIQHQDIGNKHKSRPTFVLIPPKEPCQDHSGVSLLEQHKVSSAKLNRKANNNKNNNNNTANKIYPSLFNSKATHASF